MPAQALYLKWRPRVFEDVIGQEHITRSLRNAIIQNRVRHAYLFNGPRGTGKTTLARILAKAVNCLNPNPAQRPCDTCQFCVSINEGRFLDLIEIDAASHNGVDDVRDLREKIAFAPGEGRYKVYIVDEVHRFSGAAFDALLKTLEEPPDHAIFVLATTEIDKVPATIKSRSLIFELRRVSLREVADRLQKIVESEHIKADRAALELVARLGTGSVRDSISLLDQLITDPNQRITLELAEQVLGTASTRGVAELVQAMIDNDAAAGLDAINRAIDEGADPAQFGRQIVEHLRNLMLIQTGGPSLVDTSKEQLAILQQQASALPTGALIRNIRAFNTAVTETRGGWQPQLPLELAFIESTRPLQETVVVSAPAQAPAAVKTRPAAKPAPPPEPEPETPQTHELTVTLTDVQRAWPVIHRTAKEQNMKLGALLDHTAVKALDGQTLVLAANGSIFKEKLDNDEKRRAIADYVKAVLKVPLTIKIVLASAAPTNDTIVDDDLLNYATSELGGTIETIEDTQGGVD
ncbi:MAG: DNA polymerase III subunit gamma/tau [Anaerolineae bacterium]|nr:DNA polymerase III subunit gamma/tau [Anaerolineae bacterium]